MSEVTATMKIALTPEQVAAAFWGFDSGEHARFFAELHRIASWKLDMQLSWVGTEIAEGRDIDAMMGFGSFSGCAKDLPNIMLDYRIAAAKREIGARP